MRSFSRTMATLMGVAVLAVLAACQLFPEPKTFNERLATGYATVTTVRQGTTTLLNAKVISSTDAQNVQNQANAARDGLDVAQNIHASLPKQSEDKLKASLDILEVLKKYVESKGAH